MVGIGDVPWYPEIDENEGPTIYEDEVMIMDHTDQKREATRRRRDDEATGTDEGEASNTVHQEPFSIMGTSATTSRPHQQQRRLRMSSVVQQQRRLRMSIKHPRGHSINTQQANHRAGSDEARRH